MAVLLDERARGLVRSRREAGKAASLWIHRMRTPKSGWVAAVDWAGSGRPDGRATLLQIGDTDVWVDEKIAAYARWHPVILTAVQSGPLRSVVLDDPILMFHIGSWEASHPGLRVA